MEGVKLGVYIFGKISLISIKHRSLNMNTGLLMFLNIKLVIMLEDAALEIRSDRKHLQ